MKMVRNEHGVTAWHSDNWERNQLELVLNDDKLYVIADTKLKVRIGDGRVDFIVGAPGDLMNALLSLTSECDTEPLAGFTACGKEG